MSAGRPYVLLADPHPEITQLMALVLEDAGYAVRDAGDGPLVDIVRREQPDLVVLALPREAEAAGALLDSLRGDPVASAVPVLATGALPRQLEAALASYNVRAALSRPFDLDAFLAAVGQALGQPPLHAVVAATVPSSSGRRRAAQVLADHAREALFRWVQRLRQETIWQERQDVPLGGILDSVPALVEALDVALMAEEVTPGDFLRALPQVFDRVRDHARARHRQAIPLTAVVREYTLLRNEVWGIFRRYLPDHLTATEVLDVEETVNFTLDRIIEATIESYVALLEAGPSVSA